MMTDPIADMFTRIRNGGKAKFEKVEMPCSNSKVNIAKILKDSGYIKDYTVTEDDKQGILQIVLKYDADNISVFTEIIRISKPSRRVYVNKNEIPQIKNGLGTAIISTSKGILADKDAREQNVGGEVIGSFW
jgi:small subunit ribosomal protein S8